MSFLDDLKEQFESQIRFPIVINEGNQFQAMGNANIQVFYGERDDELPTAPPITYNKLYPKFYHFSLLGSNEEKFKGQSDTIMSMAFDAVADAMERFVTTDEALISTPLTSVDELKKASEDFGRSHYGSYISLSFSHLSKLNKTMFKGRCSVLGHSFPYDWNYLDKEVHFFNHSNKNGKKVILFLADESFVLSDINFFISKNHLCFQFSIGANSKSCIKVFNLPN